LLLLLVPTFVYFYFLLLTHSLTISVSFTVLCGCVVLCCVVVVWKSFTSSSFQRSSCHDGGREVP
jgi:hypothetical protein